MKKTAVLAALLLLLGASVLLYPLVSRTVNRRNSSYAIQNYEEQVSGLGSAEAERQLALARAYNEALLSGGTVETDYGDILNFGGGILGYVEIETLGLRLPIYHGTSEEVLSKAVGHLETSSFPIGGAGCHAVLTGHTGVPGAELFTHLTALQVGDRFTVTVAHLTLPYEIDQILTVLPHETDALRPDPEQDLCTLVTCTPYGVNSHRLLVRGVRVE